MSDLQLIVDGYIGCIVIRPDGSRFTSPERCAIRWPVTAAGLVSEEKAVATVIRGRASRIVSPRLPPAVAWRIGLRRG